MMSGLGAAFFRKLADRFTTENDLSDITWALCESSEKFKLFFLSFFFPEITEVAGVQLVREYVAENNHRPDFQFGHPGLQKSFLIEVKLNDRNTHFAEYKNAFPGYGFGWIACYAQKEPGVITRTWNEFAAALKQWIHPAELSREEFSFPAELPVSGTLRE